MSLAVWTREARKWFLISRERRASSQVSAVHRNATTALRVNNNRKSNSKTLNCSDKKMKFASSFSVSGRIIWRCSKSEHNREPCYLNCLIKTTKDRTDKAIANKDSLVHSPRQSIKIRSKVLARWPMAWVSVVRFHRVTNQESQTALLTSTLLQINESNWWQQSKKIKLIGITITLRLDQQEFKELTQSLQVHYSSRRTTILLMKSAPHETRMDLTLEELVKTVTSSTQHLKRQEATA